MAAARGDAPRLFLVGRVEMDQLAMVHRLPAARVVDRVEYLAQFAHGKSVTHVGFADAGFREMQDVAGTWLHAHLSNSARTLTGLDVDEEGVAAAIEAGYDAHVVDCCDATAVAQLGLPPVDLVVAG